MERLRRNASVTQYHEATIVPNTIGTVPLTRRTLREGDSPVFSVNPAERGWAFGRKTGLSPTATRSHSFLKQGSPDDGNRQTQRFPPYTTWEWYPTCRQNVFPPLAPLGKSNVPAEENQFTHEPAGD